MSKTSSSSSSQSSVARSMSMVRLALVTSVTCSRLRPPVRFQISQDSMVPKRASPRLGALRAGPARGRAASELGGGEVGGQRQAGRRGDLRRGVGEVGDEPAVRVSCQMIARASGRPVCRSQRTVVSRWLAMPMAAMSSAVRPACAQRLGHHPPHVRQISAASCSAHPGRGKSSGGARVGRRPRIRPAWLNRRQRVEAVPWSMAAITRSVMRTRRVRRRPRWPTARRPAAGVGARPARTAPRPVP